MPQPLRLALIAFALLGILGLVVYGFVRSFKKSADPTKLAVKWSVTLIVVGLLYWNMRYQMKSGGGSFVGGAVTAALIVFPCVAAAILFSIMWTESIGSILMGPLLAAFDGGNEENDPTPLYSTAEALRKRGRYRESIYAIQEQLQKFPTDFTGQMMLAEIQAENMNDMEAAETTIHRFCEQPDHSPSNVAFALNTLADWQLKHRQDAEAAEQALEKIVELLPGGEYERGALNRIAHLATTEQLVRAREPAMVKMKQGVEYLSRLNLEEQRDLLPKEKEMKQEAAELVAHLDLHPLDHEARERLAVIYAREYGRVDFAAEQIEQLVALPNESPKHIARWLNLLADLQVEVTGKTELAEATLRRIIELFPNQSQAELARARIDALPLELRRYETTRVVKFGASEKVESRG